MSLGTCWLCAEPCPGARICMTCFKLRYAPLEGKQLRRRHIDVWRYGRKEDL